MTLGRRFRNAFFLLAAALLAMTIGAKPLYAVDDGSTGAKKTDQQKKTAKAKKEKKPSTTTAAPVGNRYPNDVNVPGSGY